MFDLSYNPRTLSRLIKKSEFKNVSEEHRESFRTDVVNAAMESLSTIFNGENPIDKFHLKGKDAYRFKDISDELLIRKLSANIKKVSNVQQPSRAQIITNLIHFIRETVPYRVYRLDIKSFYESFEHDGILQKIYDLNKLDPISKKISYTFFKHYKEIGGRGLPRGLALSAIVSELIMKEFDLKIKSISSVYFYSRYVDDIIIVTNSTECENNFIGNIESILPCGLALNKDKQEIMFSGEFKKRNKIFDFNYLGYNFSVFESNKKQNFRTVKVEISKNKIKKIKTRIIKSLLDYSETNDQYLLTQRIKMLSSNFSIIDPNNGKRKLAGIFHNYPKLEEGASSLEEIDNFIKYLLTSKKGRTISLSTDNISQKLKRNLLKFSFKSGWKTQRFFHFSPYEIARIQKCWKYE